LSPEDNKRKRKKQTPEFASVNLALTEGAKFTASNQFKKLSPEEALPGRSRWMATVAQTWWCCEFPEPIIIGTFGFTILGGLSAPSSFSIDGGNPPSQYGFPVMRALEDLGPVWKTIFKQPTETTPPGQTCLYDLQNREKYKFCRITIYQTRGSAHAALKDVVINERVLD
jgi:hypothetical protein